MDFKIHINFRQQKFGIKSKENEEFSKPKKHIELSIDNTDGTSIINGGSIKDRLVALKKSGQTDWQKRILKIKPEDHEVSNNSINVCSSLPIICCNKINCIILIVLDGSRFIA